MSGADSARGAPTFELDVDHLSEACPLAGTWPDGHPYLIVFQELGLAVRKDGFYDWTLARSER